MCFHLVRTVFQLCVFQVQVYDTWLICQDTAKIGELNSVLS